MGSMSMTSPQGIVLSLAATALCGLVALGLSHSVSWSAVFLVVLMVEIPAVIVLLIRTGHRASRPVAAAVFDRES